LKLANFLYKLKRSERSWIYSSGINTDIPKLIWGL
jgi:hypothetical protein